MTTIKTLLILLLIVLLVVGMMWVLVRARGFRTWGDEHADLYPDTMTKEDRDVFNDVMNTPVRQAPRPDEGKRVCPRCGEDVLRRRNYGFRECERCGHVWKPE